MPTKYMSVRPSLRNIGIFFQMATSSVSSDPQGYSAQASVIDIVSKIVDGFQEEKIEMSSVEKNSLDKVRSRIEKLQQNNMLQKSSEQNLLAHSENMENFMDSFTTSAFVFELDALRTSETMTVDDMATLAEAIRNFERGLSSQDRDMYISSLVSSKSMQ